jgi:hypothetical protein
MTHLTGISASPLLGGDDVADIESNAVVHLAMIWECLISAPQIALNSDGTLLGIYGTGEFHQEIISRCIHYASSMLPNEGGHHVAGGRADGDGGHFIVGHQQVVACDIGAANRSSLSFHTPSFRCYFITLAEQWQYVSGASLLSC